VLPPTIGPLCRLERLSVVAAVVLIGWALSVTGAYGVGLVGDLLLAGVLAAALVLVRR
jgi:hypothetical protein